MNKTIKILALVFLFSFVLYGGRSFAQYNNPGSIFDYGPYGTVGTAYETTGWDTFEASWWIGHEVSSPVNGYLGRISDLVMDQVNGRVALVILSDVPGLGVSW